MRIRARVPWGASVIMATLVALLLTACNFSGQGRSYGSGHHANRHYDHVYGDYSSFRYGHHRSGSHGYRHHLYRRHNFH